MAGKRIDEFNKGLQRLQCSLKDKFDFKLAIDILQFGTVSCWKSIDDLPLKTGGVTNIGEALRFLYNYGSSISSESSCAILFSMDGYSTDQYKETLHILNGEKWFSCAVKSAIGIGRDFNFDELSDITGCLYAVISVGDEHIHSLSYMVESISVASVAAAVKNHSQSTSIEGRNIIDWIDNENIDEEL